MLFTTFLDFSFLKLYVLFCKETRDSGRKCVSCGEYEEGKEKEVEETNLTCAYTI